jgi:hypothetical protein
MSAVTVSVLARKRARAPTGTHLPSWAETDRASARARPSPTIAAILRDLVSWGCDIAIVVSGGCPEDRSSIERVRGYAHAWLAGRHCPEIDIDDVLTTVAAAMAGIDRDVGGTVFDDEHQAAGAAGRR